ncbi:hypothetical protein JXI42_05205 [bacterium]|nr:hypothetical protein [bacterium]
MMINEVKGNTGSRRSSACVVQALGRSGLNSEYRLTNDDLRSEGEIRVAAGLQPAWFRQWNGKK